MVVIDGGPDGERRIDGYEDAASAKGKRRLDKCVGRLQLLVLRYSRKKPLQRPPIHDRDAVAGTDYARWRCLPLLWLPQMSIGTQYRLPICSALLLYIQDSLLRA